MSQVLLIIQLIISIILTGLILIQRSEGGALGIGGGGGGGFMSGRSATTSIARMTGILGAIFIVNCLALSIVFNMENQNTSLLDDTNAATSIIDNTNTEDPLTKTIDSSDSTIPLADDTPAAETPETETAGEADSEVAEEPKDDE